MYIHLNTRKRNRTDLEQKIIMVHVTIYSPRFDITIKNKMKLTKRYENETQDYQVERERTSIT